MLNEPELLTSILLHILLPKCYELQERCQWWVSNTFIGLAVLEAISFLCVFTVKQLSWDSSLVINPQEREATYPFHCDFFFPP